MAGICSTINTFIIWNICHFSVQCDIIGEIINGNVTYSTNGTITSAQFVCDIGGSMVGSAQLTCLTNGHWDESPPTCGMSKHFINKDRKL